MKKDTHSSEISLESLNYTSDCENIVHSQGLGEKKNLNLKVIIPKDDECFNNEDEIFESISGLHSRIAEIKSLPVPVMTNSKISKVKEYLGQYGSIYKDTLDKSQMLAAKRTSDLALISNLFSKLRKELDDKEHQIRQKYLDLIVAQQEALDQDLAYLKQK